MTLVLIDDDSAATVVARVPEGVASAEHPLRDLIFSAPQILPLHELEPELGRIIPVAIEVNLPGAGLIDVLLVSEYGRLILVECKLWRNPQARREVVGQILDYARELAALANTSVPRQGWPSILAWSRSPSTGSSIRQAGASGSSCSPVCWPGRTLSTAS